MARKTLHDFVIHLQNAKLWIMPPKMICFNIGV